MTPIEEINYQCHNSADLVVSSCETVDQCYRRMMEQQLTAPVNEIPRLLAIVEEKNHCHNRANLVVGHEVLDPCYCQYNYGTANVNVH